MLGYTLCVDCELAQPGPNGELVCAAFPDKIPEEILEGEFDHRDNFPGDGGITFVPRQGAPDDAELDRRYAPVKS